MATNEAIEAPPEPLNYRKTVLAAVAGNFVEWYEFIVFGTVAAYVSLAYFPADDPAAALIRTWAVYGSAFLVRPFGGLLLAWLGDLYGRRTVLAASIMLMSLATFGLGALPGYATIGLAAPVLVLIFRMVQGAAAGGELPTAVAFLYEHSPEHSRTHAIKLLQSTTFGANAAGSGLAALLTLTMSEASFAQWGWRIVFLIALPLGLVGYFIRRRVEETPEFKRMQASVDGKSRPLRGAIQNNWRVILTYIGFGSLYTTTAFITAGVYLGVMLASGIRPTVALMINTLTAALVVVSILVFGTLSERFGRKVVLIAGAATLAVLIIPAFVLAGTGSVAGAVLGGVLIAVPFGVYATPAVMCLSSFYPTSVRVTAGALGYNVCTLVGGFAPLIAVWLNARTGSGLAFPAYVAALALLAAAVLALAFPERRHQRGAPVVEAEEAPAEDDGSLSSRRVVMNRDRARRPGSDST